MRYYILLVYLLSGMFELFSLNFLLQGKCDPSHEDFFDMMEDCQNTCSDSECQGPAGNDDCQDTTLDCPRYKHLVKRKLL